MNRTLLQLLILAPYVMNWIVCHDLGSVIIIHTICLFIHSLFESSLSVAQIIYSQMKG
jgi:hypothetical protein